MANYIITIVTMPTNISVIIPSYNSAKTIANTLRSVLDQDTDQPYEVMVVDSSQDETPDIIRQGFPQVQLIHLEQRTDQGTARNIGLREAKGEILFFTDADCLVRRNWISRMLAEHKDDYIAVGGPIINANQDSAVGWASYLLEFNDLFPPGLNDQQPSRAVWHLPTGNISYKRQVFERHGGFPAPLKFALEDLLFHWKLGQQGCRMLSVPDIQVTHYHRETLRDFLFHQHKLGRGTVQLLRQTDMEGSDLVKKPVLATIALPLIPIVKFFRTSYRFYRWRPDLFLRHPMIFPAMALGLIFWGAGFGRELYSR